MSVVKKRILIAEDDLELLDLLKLHLSRQGYDALCAVSGREALTSAVAEKPDIVLLDVMLPEIDGYHVARELCNKLGEYCPKILIMTSRDISREKGVALMSGATATIQKPFKMEDLDVQLKRLF